MAAYPVATHKARLDAVFQRAATVNDLQARAKSRPLLCVPKSLDTFSKQRATSMAITRPGRPRPRSAATLSAAFRTSQMPTLSAFVNSPETSTSRWRANLRVSWRERKERNRQRDEQTDIRSRTEVASGLTYLRIEYVLRTRRRHNRVPRGQCG